MTKCYNTGGVVSVGRQGVSRRRVMVYNMVIKICDRRPAPEKVVIRRVMITLLCRRTRGDFNGRNYARSGPRPFGGYYYCSFIVVIITTVAIVGESRSLVLFGQRKKEKIIINNNRHSCVCVCVCVDHGDHGNQAHTFITII